MEDIINSLPALGANNPEYRGVVGLILVIAYIVFRWRRNAGVVSASEALGLFGVAVMAGVSLTLAGGWWPEVASNVGLAAVLAGVITLKIQARRDRGRKNRNQVRPAPG